MIDPQLLAQLEREMERRLSPQRFAHCQAVASYCAQLAPALGLDPRQAWQAGLLHDLQHYQSDEELLAAALIYGLEVGPAELEAPLLLHGPLAAAILDQDYGVDDQQLLEAIRCHTVPQRQMGDLAKLVFVADVVEPTRPPWPGQEQIRSLLAAANLNAAVAAALERTLEYLRKRGKTPHPETESILAYYQALL